MEKDKVIYLNKLSVDDIDEIGNRFDLRIERVENILLEVDDKYKVWKGLKLITLLYRQKAHLFQMYFKHISQQSLPKFPSGGTIHTSGYVTNQESIEQLKRFIDDLT